MNLYLDIGATHIKLMHKGKIEVFEYLTKDFVDVKDFSNFVRNILASYNFTKLYTCSQMHGFHVEGTPNYVSWMCEDVEPSNKEELKDTGLFPCHGLPYFNSKMFSGGHIQTLIDTILDEVYHVSHETLECGTGFYDLKRRCQKETKFTLPRVVLKGPEVCGKIGKSDVYAPLGDLQAAVLGIEQELEIGDIIINMGTGSQVIQISKEFREDTENRPLFDYYLNCITHIPSGRSMKFYKDLFNLPDFSALKFDDIIKSTETINLGYFKSAYKYDKQSGIIGIHENTTPYTIACSLIRCYVKQYVDIISKLFENKSRVFLTGGIAKNIPLIRKLFEHYLSETVFVENNDTLKGLYKYSLYDHSSFWFNR